jgi:hypothetical protein
MFRLPVRLAHGAHANGAERITEPHVAGTVAIGAVEAFWLMLIAALFVVWAVSPNANQSRGLTGSSPGCLFMGKAGVICVGSAGAAQQPSTESRSCISFGRGGRYCPPTR